MTNTYAASQQWINQTAKTLQELTDNFIQVEEQQIPVTFSSTGLRPHINQVVLYLKISLESEMPFSKLPHTIIHCITSLHIPFKNTFHRLHCVKNSKTMLRSLKDNGVPALFMTGGSQNPLESMLEIRQAWVWILALPLTCHDWSQTRWPSEPPPPYL